MMKNTNDMKDPQIAYWANLCEGASDNLDDNAVNEAIDSPYLWDVEMNPPIFTVKDLKRILMNFNDNDQIEIYGTDNENLEIKAVWNSAEEISLAGDGIDVADNKCFIRVAEA